MEIGSKYQERIYHYNEACVFRKTKEAFGGLSNMASGFPLHVNGIPILSSEALYQACRFPHLPDVQKKILSERSPMTAKMVSKPHRNNTRPDWDNVRIDIMYWCLQVKLAQHFISFGQLLESTFNKPIVEESGKDPFWGAIKVKEEPFLQGINALGRLLMKLRLEYYSRKFDLLLVPPLNISNFSLYGKPIEKIDERMNFVDILLKYWNLNIQEKAYEPSSYYKSIAKTSTVNEPTPYIHKLHLPLNGSFATSTKLKSEQEKNNDAKNADLDMQICDAIRQKPLTAKEIVLKLHLDWTANKLANYLRTVDYIETIKRKNGNEYNLKLQLHDPHSQPKLF